MFDIGFFELVIIAVIALLVLGPERLPHAVRMTAAWMGKFRRAALSVREEIEREVNAMEVQQRLKEQLDDSGVNEAKEMLEETKQTLRNGILDEETLKEIEKRGLQDYAKKLVDPETPAPSAALNADNNSTESTETENQQAPAIETKAPEPQSEETPKPTEKPA